jgi:hypothetical protein
MPAVRVVVAANAGHWLAGIDATLIQRSQLVPQILDLWLSACSSIPKEFYQYRKARLPGGDVD